MKHFLVNAKMALLTVLIFSALNGCANVRIVSAPVVDAGQHQSFKQGERAAIQRLSAYIKNPPPDMASSNLAFKVKWSVLWPGDKKRNLPRRGGSYEIVYRRQQKLLEVYAAWESLAPQESYLGIETAEIHAVADKHGVLKDFENFDTDLK